MADNKNLRRHFWQAAHLFVENAVTNNIVLIQALGLCPIIAAGTTLKNGVTLTVCTAIVLVPLSFFIALVGNYLAKWLRPAIYVLLAAVLLGATGYVLGTYISPELYARLYLFIPLMAVNMLYTRSVGLSTWVNPLATVVDALGSTLGFGMVICLISAIREMAISNTLWDIPVQLPLTLSEATIPFTAFVLLGFMSALLQWCRQRVSAYFHRKEADEE